MKIRATSIPGLKVIEPEPKHDHRGSFVRILSAEVFAEAGIDVAGFVQENQSRSARRVLRGLHVRAPVGETKVVRCASGKIFDVVVDLRPRSAAFGCWESFILDDRQHLGLIIPPGCAHGFQCLSEIADVCYRHDRFYDASQDVAVVWDDPELAVPWPLPDPILSNRDRAAPRLAELRPRLETWFGSGAAASPRSDRAREPA